jgi:hypothetical protein
MAPENRLCSLISRATGDDPAGSATPFDAYLGVEVRLPWRNDVAQSPRFPPGLWDAVQKVWSAGAISKFTGLMPEPGRSREGHARILLMRRPAPGPFALYDRTEYLVPDGKLVALVEALARPEDLARFEGYREEGTGLRDFLVCTHNSRDVCCGRFGTPIHKALLARAANDPGLRVWRTSHMGGHRFAPTVMEFPDGRYWGHLEPEVVGVLVERDVPFSELRAHYRGWAGMGSKFEQIAEREILAREGWAWAAYPKQGHLLSADDEGAQVRIEYEPPDGPPGAYEAEVVAAGSVMTLASSGPDPLEEVRQYRVARLEKVS